MSNRPFHRVTVALAVVLILGTGPVVASTDLAKTPFQGGVNFIEGTLLPTGKRITPEAALGALFQPLNPGLPEAPDYLADHAVDTAISPDGKTLLILTSGYNRYNDAAGNRLVAASNEYVFVFDISGQKPIQKQAIQIPNTFNGIVWNPKGNEFYVSGGVDDNMHIYNQNGGQWVSYCARPRW